MKILGIDTSTQVASVAVMDENIVIGEFTINTKKTHSQKIMPMLEKLLFDLDIDISEIDRIAVANGPGSFTGVRIGVTVAKGLAHANNTEVVTMSTLAAMAFNYMDSDYIVCPLIDARRDQVYSAIYTFDESKPEVKSEDDIVMIDDLIEKLKIEVEKTSKKVVILGDCVEKFAERIEEAIPGKLVLSSPPMRITRGSSVALASNYIGEKTNYNDAKVNYLRVTEAERNLKNK